jgi:adenosylcobinamide kinase/adenosylcobinamide-phosphate guanylyltransferase
VTVLIIGPNNSGKSAYAEKLALRLSAGRLTYIATLLPIGEDGAARVAKHRAQRAGMGFITVEAPYADVVPGREDTVLLEDVSNLLANLIFEKRVPAPENAALETLLHLEKACKNLIAVSIGGLNEAEAGDEETANYICALERVNDVLARRSGVVLEMVSGKPVLRKGLLPCL